MGKLTKILEPSGMERGKLEDTLAAWEDEVLKYEKESNSRLSDDVKIEVLMIKTRGQFQEHLRLKVASSTRYHDVKGVVTNYIKTNRFPARVLQRPRCNGHRKSLQRKGHVERQREGKGKAVVCFKCGGQGHIAPQ